MGHQTDAFIGKLPVNLEKVKFYGLGVAFEDEFAIVFLEEDHLLHWSKKLNKSYLADEGDLSYGGELIRFFAKEIGFIDYLVVQLDYSFVGVLYQDGKMIDEGQINPMLKFRCSIKREGFRISSIKPKSLSFVRILLLGSGKYLCATR
jgi:hypothetical protein